jgi:hypothetical protein
MGEITIRQPQVTGRTPGVMYEKPPFDLEELIKLIKKEYEADSRG